MKAVLWQFVQGNASNCITLLPAGAGNVVLMENDEEVGFQSAIANVTVSDIADRVLPAKIKYTDQTKINRSLNLTKCSFGDITIYETVLQVIIIDPSKTIHKITAPLKKGDGKIYGAYMGTK